MANFVTNFIGHVSVSAVIGAAVGVAAVYTMRDPSIEGLSRETAGITTQLTALETAAADRQSALQAQLAELAGKLDALKAAFDAAATAPSTADATADAALVARHGELMTALADLRAGMDTPATLDLQPALDALARIEALVALQ